MKASESERIKALRSAIVSVKTSSPKSRRRKFPSSNMRGATPIAAPAPLFTPSAQARISPSLPPP